MYLKRYSKANYYKTKISALLDLEYLKVAAINSKNLPAPIREAAYRQV